jgi:type I restriction enzyme, S subunit
VTIQTSHNALVPLHWTWKKLKYIASLKSGDNISSESIAESGDYPVYGGNGLRGFTSRFTHRGNYVLIGRQGALCGNVNFASGVFWASEHAIVVDTHDKCSVRWLGGLLSSMELNQYSQSAAQPGLSVETIANLEVAVPPLREQRDVADLLDRETARIDGLIAKKQQLIGSLEEKRLCETFLMVTKGFPVDHPLRGSGIGWMGSIPQHWQVIRLKRVAKLFTGHTPSRQHAEYWSNCTIPWVSLADVWQLRDETREYVNETKEKISELGLANSAARLLPAKTVIVSRTASIGFSGILPRPMATTQDFVNWVCGPRLIPEYLLYVFRSMKPEFDRLTNGSTHQTIYMPDVWSFTIPLPPVDEQEMIVQAIRTRTRSIDSLITMVRRAVESLREYRTALISAAVTGQIDVQTYRKEPETVLESIA